MRETKRYKPYVFSCPKWGCRAWRLHETNAMCTKHHYTLWILRITRPGFHLGAQKKNVKLRHKQSHMKDTGKSSSRKLRRAIYYILYRMVPQITHYKISFSAKMSKIENSDFCFSIKSPLTPDQPPLAAPMLIFGRGIRCCHSRGLKRPKRTSFWTTHFSIAHVSH